MRIERISNTQNCTPGKCRVERWLQATKSQTLPATQLSDLRAAKQTGPCKLNLAALTSGRRHFWWLRPGSSLFIHREWSLFSWEDSTQSEAQDIKEKGKKNHDGMSLSSALRTAWIVLPKNFCTNQISNFNFPLRNWGPHVRVFSKEASRISLYFLCSVGSFLLPERKIKDRISP